jgi:hypothetical protein
MKMEDVGQRVWNIPALGKPRREIEMLIAPNKRVEDEFIDSF